MDDYVAKPIQLGQFAAVIKKWEKKCVVTSEPPDSKPLLLQDVFDEKNFSRSLDGDVSFMKEILSMFLDDAPGQLQKIRTYLDSRDFQNLQLQAHSLKGAAAHVCGKTLQTAALNLETAAKNHDLDELTALVRAAEAELERFKEAASEAGYTACSGKQADSSESLARRAIRL